MLLWGQPALHTWQMYFAALTSRSLLMSVKQGALISLAVYHYDMMPLVNKFHIWVVFVNIGEKEQCKRLRGEL